MQCQKPWVRDPWHVNALVVFDHCQNSTSGSNHPSQTSGILKFKNSIEDIGIQTALNPEDFFNLLNSGEVIEELHLNEEGDRNKKYYHKLKYDGTVFVTSTETEIYEL